MLDAYVAAASMFTMAKGNFVAREQYPGAYGGRGRPPKYGKKIWLKELFPSQTLSDLELLTVKFFKKFQNYFPAR